MNSVPPPVASAPISGQRLHVGLGDEAAGRAACMREDVEPGDVVGHQQHRARDAAAARAPPAAMPSTRSMLARPPGLTRCMRAGGRPARGKRSGTIGHAVQRMQHRAQQPPRRRAAPHACAARARRRSAIGQATQRGAPRGRAAHPARQLVAGERRVLALAAQRRGLAPSSAPPGRTRTGRPRRPRPAGRRWPASVPSASPSTRAGSLRHARPARAPGQRRSPAPHLQRQAQQQLQPGGAGLGLGEGQGLGVLVDRRVVGHQRVDGAVGQRRAQRVAVALLAQRRRQAHAASK